MYRITWTFNVFADLRWKTGFVNLIEEVDDIDNNNKPCKGMITEAKTKGFILSLGMHLSF